MTYRRYERPPRPRRDGPSSLPWLLIFIPFALLFVYFVAPGPWRSDESDEAPHDICAAGCVATGGPRAPLVAEPPAASAKPVGPMPYANQDPERWTKSTSVAPPRIYGPNAAVVEA